MANALGVAVVDGVDNGAGHAAAVLLRQPLWPLVEVVEQVLPTLSR